MTARVATVGTARGFVDILADGLIAEHGHDPMALARVTLFLPTRRSVRALRGALTRRRNAPTLLPSIVALGDLDEEEGHDGAAAALAADSAPPAIDPLERRLRLAELVRASRHGASAAPAVGTLALAAALADLLDSMQTARCDFASFAALAPEELADHWREVLEFLSIVTDAWPARLRELGRTDPSERLNRVLAGLADAWRRRPPQTPVIAAGSTGSRPAAADLFAVIAGLPRGLLLLPGLDRDLDAASWDALSASHPQFGLKILLGRLGVARSQVRDWGAAPPSPRAGLLRELMRPDETVAEWRALDHLDSSAVAGLARIVCPDEQAEAEIIALAMRRALEVPGRTAALVTPDRALARRVRAELGRWELGVDDSAGQPLAAVPPGIFLRLVVAAAVAEFAPVPLLAMLKHPLCRGGAPRAEFRGHVRAFERACLRGPRPAAGLAGLKRALALRRAAAGEGAAALDGWLQTLAAILEPLAEALSGDAVPLAALASAHRAAAERLSADETGAPTLWAGELGMACRDGLDALARAATGLQPVAGRDYAAILEDALQRQRVRPQRDRHPRLFIWGTLEARLQRADLMILGGLNEGSWPRQAETGPWLSRPMAREVGMPEPERLTGLSAHDFAQLFQAPEVMLTRAAMVEGAPTVPSRWLIRLDAVLRGAALALPATPWLAWRRALDEPDEAPRPVAPPEPRPPVAVRPRELPVTQIEAWRRDPYEIYARRILRLRALERVDADLTQAEYGSAVHAALARFVCEIGDPHRADALARLHAFGREAFARVERNPGLWAFWWPRFRRVAAWFVARERAHRKAGTKTAPASRAEVAGRLVFAAPAGPFTLTARADRIDSGPGEQLTIIDYKTGALPGVGDVNAGFAPQLPLEGAILKAGGFPGLVAAPPTDLVYWRLDGGDPAGEEKSIVRRNSAAEMAQRALAGLKALVARFDDEQTPYRAHPAPQHAPRYSDYRHLARVGEWTAAAGED